MNLSTISIKLPSNIDDSDLEKYANIDSLEDQYNKTYCYIRRSVEPVGFFTHNDIILKLYHMKRENQDLPQNLVDSLNDFLLNEVENNRIDLKQKIGFAILSQGFLSINIWGRGNVLFTQTYTIEDSFPELSPKTLEKTGVACTWEIKVMKYEYDLWHDYLKTKMSLEDKKIYLENFLSGNLDLENSKLKVIF